MGFMKAKFSTTFKSEPKSTLTKTSMRPVNATIQEHKQLSSTKMFPGQSNDKADDSDYPDLTSDSGDDSNFDDEANMSEFSVPVHSLNSEINNCKQTVFLGPDINDFSIKINTNGNVVPKSRYDI
jgi:hypothetical protein